jgi:hypothetical protein
MLQCCLVERYWLILAIPTQPTIPLAGPGPAIHAFFPFEGAHVGEICRLAIYNAQHHKLHGLRACVSRWQRIGAQMISGDQFEGALMQGAPSIEFEKTALGVRYNLVKDLPNGNRFVRRAECIVPNAFIIPNIREAGRTAKRKERGSELSWAVPIDTGM